MKKKKLMFMMMLFLSVGLFAQSAEDKKMIGDAQQVKAEMIKTNPKMQGYFDDAKAYAIFPNVGKGALIVGAASGHGAVYERGTLVGIAKLKQVDIGAQIGGEAYGEVVFFKTDEALQNFMNGDLKFTGQVSAVAVKESATINIKYDTGIAVYTLPKGGLMAEVSVGGQHFSYDALNN